MLCSFAFLNEPGTNTERKEIWKEGEAELNSTLFVVYIANE